MANTGKDTNRAQFFLLFRPQPHLNGKHVVFGTVKPSSLPVLRQVCPMVGHTVRSRAERCSLHITELK